MSKKPEDDGLAEFCDAMAEMFGSRDMPEGKAEFKKMAKRFRAEDAAREAPAEPHQKDPDHDR